MSEHTLLISALVAAASAALYAYAGYRLSQRPVSRASRSAARAFGVWWFALAGSTLMGGVQRLLGYLGILDLGTHVMIAHLNFLLISVALWGLLYYLVYLYTGQTRWMTPLAVFYVGFFLWVSYLITTSNPASVTTDAWRVTLAYANEPSSTLVLGFVAALVGPQILGAIGYASLYFRVETRTQRYRILVVSMSILAWFASSLVATLTGISSSQAWQVGSQAIGLAAAGAILLAYFPPAWLQRWLDVSSLDASA